MKEDWYQLDFTIKDKKLYKKLRKVIERLGEENEKIL